MQLYPKEGELWLYGTSSYYTIGDSHMSKPFIWGTDPYKPEKKPIKIIKLPKVKKRFVY